MRKSEIPQKIREIGSMALPLAVKSGLASGLVWNMDSRPDVGSKLAVLGVGAFLGLANFGLSRLNRFDTSRDNPDYAAASSFLLGLNTFLIPEIIKTQVMPLGMKAVLLGFLGLTELTAMYAAKQIGKPS